MPIFQILRGATVDTVSPFPAGAVIADGGASVSWSGGGLTLPSGYSVANQAGAGVGWTLINGTLVPPGETTTALRAYANAKADALRAVARSYTISGGPTALCDATQGTGSDLIGLLNWGTANPTVTTDFVQDNGGVVTLTGAQCATLALAVLAYGQSVFAALAAAMNGIANQTIASTSQIDALSWPN